MVGKKLGVSDRSGFVYPRNEMIKEPGTGYWIHRSESDGRFNAVDHPQNNPTKYIRFDDNKVVENARDIEQDTDAAPILEVSDGDYFRTESGSVIYLRTA